MRKSRQSFWRSGCAESFGNGRDSEGRDYLPEDGGDLHRELIFITCWEAKKQYLIGWFDDNSYAIGHLVVAYIYVDYSVSTGVFYGVSQNYIEKAVEVVDAIKVRHLRRLFGHSLFREEVARRLWGVGIRCLTVILNSANSLQTLLFDSLNCFSLVLVGEPYLNHILDKQLHEALRQRITVHYNYEGLSD